MKILVTGGNGFVGKYIVRELASRGIEVVSYDIMHSEQRLDNVEYELGTILDEFTLIQSMQGCDAVFHLAAILGVKRADTQLLKCLTVNVEGTLSVFRSAIMAGVKHLLITSSSEVFGDVSKEKLSENSPFNPKSGYAISKLVGEQYIKGFAKEFGIDFNIVRFFNVYGPGQVAEFVVPRFIKMVQNGIPPQIYGDGSQIRSFCHIADAARATVDIFLEKKALNISVNIGNDLEPVSVLELAEKVLALSDKNMKPEFIPFSESDRNSSREIYYRVPDITLVKKLVGYEPQIMLEEGLNDVIDSGDIPDTWVEPIER
jgi:UDP-glucose 4-epimerase